ncbi:MAG: bifunctional riboflavin kinase/FAD synthetase [Parvularculales bacterium]
MKIIRHFDTVAPDLKGACFALGNFDGVHRGHCAVIREAATAARSRSVPLGVLVFEPHPRRYFKPDEPFFQLTPFRVRTHLLKQLGVDILAALPFDHSMATRSAESFVCDVLSNGLGASHAAVGYDFAFGQGRDGDSAALEKLGKQYGFSVSVCKPVSVNGMAYSSTRIRVALQEGRPEEAARLLGRWWRIEGRVIKGDQRGRTLGFPTANVSLEGYVEPAHGVYAVQVDIMDGPHKGRQVGVANLGRRPTFNKDQTMLEVHLFDWDADIYGAHLSVAFAGLLRPERKFDGLESLKAQIAEDSIKARALMGGMADEETLFGAFDL